MKRRKVTSPVFQGRRLFLMLALLLVIGVLVLRAIWLEIFQQDMLQERADKRLNSTVTQTAYRGMILDRHGEPLAVSTPVEAMWADPKVFMEAREKARHAYEQAVQLAATTQGEGRDLIENSDAMRRYAEMDAALRLIEEANELEEGSLLAKIERLRAKRNISLGKPVQPEVAEEVDALDIPGIGSKTEYRRYYPMAQATAHVVGFVDASGAGKEGIEGQQEATLAGQDGKKRVIRDAHRRVVEDIERIEDRVSGKDVRLSLDSRIQYVAFQALAKQVYQLKAKAGSAVVMDAHTGEVLSLVNLPTFNPNDLRDWEDYKARNRAVTDTHEPGSTIKPLTIAAALESRALGEDVQIDTSPGRIDFGKHVIRDPINRGDMTLSQILAKSSNVGATRVALLVDPRSHWMFLRRMGFGQMPNAGFFAENAGKLSNYASWGKVDRASHGYGYGLSASLLQVAHAYTPFAAGGKLMPASIYKVDKLPLGQDVLAPANAQAVLRMMEAVVNEGGTGKRARIEGYRVAGKTGTARKYIGGKYRKDRFLTSFIGIAPASRPRLVVAVQIDEPQIEDSGGRAAAPVFSKIMSESLRLLDIPPDGLPDMKQAQQHEAPKPRTEGAT